METTGTIKVILDTQIVSDKFKKREFVLTTEGNTPYPQHVSFQVTQDKTSLLDSVGVGDEVKVQFNLRGREWNGPQGVKYFNTLEAWRIEVTQKSMIGDADMGNTNNQGHDSRTTFTPSNPADLDDLPF